MGPAITPEHIRAQIQFHDRLNPALWSDDDMRPEVRLKLLQTAMAFYHFLNIDGLLILDIIVTGSNAAYNYTALSDIDVHLIADFSSTTCPDLASNLFTAKKQLWTNDYAVKIRGFDVELYIEDVDSPVTASGIYSILHGKWLREASTTKPNENDTAVVRKTEAYAARIEDVLRGEPSVDAIMRVLKRLMVLRKNGLEHGGEFSVENLAYKSLRNLGFIDQLWDARAAAIVKKLSLGEGM